MTKIPGRNNLRKGVYCAHGFRQLQTLMEGVVMGVKRGGFHGGESMEVFIMGKVSVCGGGS